jgi:phospholipid/cholesterol/gamma-HCH transport system permease protein
MGAELGSMRVTEQIDSMEVSGTNPYKFLVVTRVLAATIMLPVLSSLSDLIGIYGSYVAFNIRGSMTLRLYIYEVFNYLKFSDILPAYIKAYFFGFAVGIIGCYKGYYTKLGTAGVGRAANSAVVVSSVLIFILDLLVVQITDLIGIG